MKKLVAVMAFGLMSITVVVVLFGLVAFLSGSGEAKIEVARENVSKRIDALLGEAEVQQKELQIEMRKMDRACDDLTKARIHSQVQAERLDKKHQELDQQIADCDAALRRLKGYLSAGGSADIGGKTYTPDQIKDMADKLLAARKSLCQQADTLKQSQTQLNRTTNLLVARETALKHQQVKLKTQIVELESEMVSLQTIKETSHLVGDNDQSLGQNLDAISKKVAAIQDRTRAELRFEEEKCKNLEANGNGADAIIAATKSHQDTIAEIDKVLAK